MVVERLHTISQTSREQRGAGLLTVSVRVRGSEKQKQIPVKRGQEKFTVRLGNPPTVIHQRWTISLPDTHSHKTTHRGGERTSPNKTMLIGNVNTFWTAGSNYTFSSDSLSVLSFTVAPMPFSRELSFFLGTDKTPPQITSISTHLVMEKSGDKRSRMAIECMCHSLKEGTPEEDWGWCKGCGFNCWT